MNTMRENDNFWDNIENDTDNNSFHQQVVYIHDGYVNGHSSKPKTRRRRWTQKDMTNAFNAVKCTGMSLRGAASHYNVPESTLRDRVHGRVSLDCSRPGPPTFFTYEEEKKMVDHILFMSKIGYPYTRNQVVELAGDMTKAVDRIAPFKFLNPSQAWFYAFLNRWPDLKNYLYGPRSNRKSKGVSAESIQAYYENLDKVLIKYDIKNKPDHIWMTDEVSIACDNLNVPKILPITIQRSQSNTYWNPTAAVLGAGNAAGDKIPAFLMFKASEISEEMMEGSVKGSKFATSNNGWVNADAFIQWYERHFRPLIPQRPVILLYDGHSQFVTVRVLEKAKEDDVLLFPLPPHPPYNHCVESSCFAAYPKYFTKRIQKYQEDFKRSVTKTNVSRIICQAYEWALQPINLIQTFFKLGICPYNNLSSSLVPYMPNSSDDDPNEDSIENMDIGEVEFVHGGVGNSNMPMFVNHDIPLVHSPIVNRSFNIHDSYPIMAAAAASSANHLNQSNDCFNSHSLSTTSIYPSIKVLDNMASKAMNQMHAHRSEICSNKIRTTLSLGSSHVDNGVIHTKLAIKNPSLGHNRSSIVMRPPQPSQIVTSALKPMVSLSSISSSSSGASTIFLTQSSGCSSNKSIKVLKASNSVIIKPSCQNSSTNHNRPIIRLQSISSSTNHQKIKSTIVLSSKVESYIRHQDDSEMFMTTTTATTTSANSNYIIKTVNTSSVSTPIVGSIDSVVGPQLLELKQEIEDDQENGEINQTCHVCDMVEPPGLSQTLSDSEELVVDWAHCDFCHQWVHLQPCCDSRCVQPDNRFKCVVCIKEEATAIESVPDDGDDYARMSVGQDDYSCYLLDEADNRAVGCGDI